MTDYTEKSKIDALVYCNVPSLPNVDDGKNIWLRAIAKVRKANGYLYYVYVKKDKELNNFVVKDFGPVSPIVEYVEYYPFDFLKDTSIKFFKNQSKEDRVRYLRENGVEKDLESMTLKELNFEVVKLGAYQQMQNGEYIK